MKKIRKNNKGFTLVELIIVVAIIAVLSAVVAPQYIKYVERSRQGVDASTLEEVRHAIEVEVSIQGAPEDEDAEASVAAGAVTVPDPYGAAADVTGDTVELKSAAAKDATFNIVIDTDGVVSWDDDAKALIEDLQAGVAGADAG